MTPEQATLLRKSKSSVEAARLLSAEGFYDFSVSRAYYAMFYLAEAFLLDDDLRFSKHTAVIALVSILSKQHGSIRNFIGI